MGIFFWFECFFTKLKNTDLIGNSLEFLNVGLKQTIDYKLSDTGFFFIFYLMLLKFVPH
jgi:hypothetical protein